MAADNAALLARMRARKKSSFQDIMIFNDLGELVGKGKDKDQDPRAPLSGGLEGLMAVYEHLYGYGFQLAGYQFVGLAVSAVHTDVAWRDQLAYFLLSCGFVVSCFSALLSFACYEYLNGIRRETNEFIVEGLERYRTWLFLPHPLLLVNTAGFAVPFNILAHTMLLPYFAWMLNALSAVLSLGFVVHWTMIVAPQAYPPAKEGDPVLRRRIHQM